MCRPRNCHALATGCPTQDRSSDHAALEPRIYKREWKRYKPHLSKSTSLPVLQLVPRNRPLFLCRQCGFTNTMIPLCLWCQWTSDDAKVEFEHSMPRSRRVTAPSIAQWKRAASAICFSVAGKPPCKEIKPQAVGFSLGVPSCEKLANISLCASGPSGTLPELVSGHSASWPHPERPRSTHDPRPLRLIPDSQCEISVVLRDGGKATAPNSFLPTFDKSRGMKRECVEKVSFHSFSPQGPGDKHELPLSSGVDRPKNPLQALKTISTKSLRSRHLVIDLKASNDPHYLIKPPADALHSTGSQLRLNQSPTKTLRRKKRFSPPRPATSAGTPMHVPSPTSSPKTPERPQPAAYLDVHPAITTPNSAKNRRAHEHPNVNTPNSAVRLGHPSRPYYTAIRPNMSRPNSFDHSHPSPSNTHTHQSYTHTHDRHSTSSRPVSMDTRSRPVSPGIQSMLSVTSALTGSLVLGEDEDENPAEHSPGPRPSFSGLLASASLLKRQSHEASVSTINQHLPPGLGGLVLTGHEQSGFSLSGETELRMALARGQGTSGGRNRETDVFGNENSTFRFRDMSKRETGVMQKVKQWKRGLKNLMRKMSI